MSLVGMGGNLGRYLGRRSTYSKGTASAEYLSQMMEERQGSSSNSSSRLAFGVREHAAALADGGSKSLVSQAVSTGDTKAVVNEVNEFVGDYNSMITRLKSSGGALEQAYLKEFKGLAQDHSDALKTIGITVGDDGKLKLDKTALVEASPETLQKCLQGGDSFVAKTGAKSVALAVTTASAGGLGLEESSDSLDWLSSDSGRKSSVSASKVARYRTRYNFNRRV